MIQSTQAERVLLAGWGSSSAGSPPNPFLKGLELTYLGKELGTPVLAQQNKTYQLNQIMATSVEGSTCKGDSGGPLLYSPCELSLLQTFFEGKCA